MMRMILSGSRREWVKACGFVGVRFATLLLILIGGLGSACSGAEPVEPVVPARTTLVLVPQAQVRADGVFLDQLVKAESEDSIQIPHLKLLDAPRPGDALVLPLMRVLSLITNLAPEFVLFPGRGPSAVRVQRATRPLHQEEILEALKTHLQREYVKGQGDLEVRLMRPWNPVTIADEPYELKVSGMPSQGILPVFQVRMELVAGREILGAWMTSVEAQWNKDLWVSRKSFKRGDLIGADDLVLERRDVLRQRDAMPTDMDPGQGWESNENISTGQVLTRRSVQIRPVLERGQVVDALYREGGLRITLKAEALDPGSPGQIIRLRNPLSKRELRGRVINAQVVHILL